VANLIFLISKNGAKKSFLKIKTIQKKNKKKKQTEWM
jgi:hypothetical protein